MRANRRSDTKPERLVRRQLRDAGHPGYRLQWPIRRADRSILCRPDITFVGRKIAIFVHGCFWHRCPSCDPPMPRSNRAYWAAKFEDNMARDRRKEQELRHLGWEVITIWECEVNQIDTVGSAGLWTDLP